MLVAGLALGVAGTLLAVRRSRRRVERRLDEAAARRVVAAWTEWAPTPRR